MLHDLSALYAAALHELSAPDAPAPWPEHAPAREAQIEQALAGLLGPLARRGG